MGIMPVQLEEEAAEYQIDDTNNTHVFTIIETSGSLKSSTTVDARSTRLSLFWCP
jgi:hypothetical protein